MCVIVRADTAADTQAPHYDRDNVALVVSDQLTQPQMLHQVRLLLSALGADQTCRPGATCWCGDPVELPHPALQAAYATIGHRAQ